MWLNMIKNIQRGTIKYLQNRIYPRLYSAANRPESAINSSTTTTGSILDSEAKLKDVQKLVAKPRYILEPEITVKQPLVNQIQQTVPFDDIPGPSSLKKISKFWSMIPVVGTELTLSVVQNLLSGGKFLGGILSWNGSITFFKKLFDAHGPVVRLHPAFGQDVILLSKPEHAITIFTNENRKSLRCCLDSVEKYRQQHRSYKQVGPFLMQGAEWNKLRKSARRPTLTHVLQHQPEIEKICDQFVNRIGEIRNIQEEMPNNFKLELYKWAIECLTFVTFNKRLGLLNIPLWSPTSDAGRLLDGLVGATEAVRKCEFKFHLWKFMETRSWKNLTRNCDMIDSILHQYVEKTFMSLKEKKSKDITLERVSMLESMILKEGSTEEDVMTALLDLFLVGTNASAHTVAFLLYHLARNPRCQFKIYEEISNKSVTGNLKNLPYVQACIKECLRLDPPIPVLSRVLDKDIIVHHYRIPKGTHTVFAMHMNSLREDYFDEAKKFKPERWLSNNDLGNNTQDFGTMAFAQGSRPNLAKEIAEMQIAMLIIKICRNYKIEYNYGDISSSHEFLAASTKPLKFRFRDRK